MGLSYSGNNCFDTTAVTGHNRLPVPPASTMPFTPSSPSPQRRHSPWLRKERPVLAGQNLRSRWERASLAGLGVLGLGRRLVRSPPGLVRLVPVHGRGEAVGERRPPRLPAELGAQLGRIHRIPTVVPGSVVAQVVGVPGLPEPREQVLDDLPIRALPLVA